MISVAALLLSAATLAFVAVQNSPKSPRSRPYAIGETAIEDVVASRKIAVVDSIATENRRQAEAAKIPVVFRLDENRSARSVADFSTEYVFTREKFLDAVEKNFKGRVLTTNQIQAPRFRKLVNTFQSGNKSFPVNFRQAALWAQGDLDENSLKLLCDKLRKTAEQLIRPDSVAQTNITFQVRLLPGGNHFSIDAAKEQGRLLRRTNFVGLAKARSELVLGFSKENRVVARFMTNFVQANCTFDPELTRQFRVEKTNSIWLVASFQAGECVVRKGDVINATSKAALDELKIYVPVSRIASNANQVWLWAGAIACFVLALIIGVAGYSRRRRVGLIPMGNVVALPTIPAADDDIRARLLPHLARGLMNRFVQALIAQRSELIRTQDAGTEQLAKLEERLDQISTRLENRQVFYETRIAQLERELAEAEEENRELIRSRIHEARQNLEWAKAQANAGK